MVCRAARCAGHQVRGSGAGGGSRGGGRGGGDGGKVRAAACTRPCELCCCGCLDITKIGCGCPFPIGSRRVARAGSGRRQRRRCATHATRQRWGRTMAAAAAAPSAAGWRGRCRCACGLESHTHTGGGRQRWPKPRQCAQPWPRAPLSTLPPRPAATATQTRVHYSGLPARPAPLRGCVPHGPVCLHSTAQRIVAHMHSRSHATGHRACVGARVPRRTAHSDDCAATPKFRT